MSARTLLILSWSSRIVLGGIFVYSGYTKIQSELQFAAAIAAYKLIPDSWLLPVATYLPWVEVILGVLILTSLKTRWVAGATAGLLVFFIVILAITYMRGIEADCGCFGMGERITPLTILRDSAFLVPALFLMLGHRFRRPEPGPV